MATNTSNIESEGERDNDKITRKNRHRKNYSSSDSSKENDKETTSEKWWSVAFPTPDSHHQKENQNFCVGNLPQPIFDSSKVYDRLENELFVDNGPQNEPNVDAVLQNQPIVIASLQQNRVGSRAALAAIREIPEQSSNIRTERGKPYYARFT